MTWTTVALIFVAWCLVSVVAGLAFAFFFGSMNRIHPKELERDRGRDLEPSREKEAMRFAKRRVKARTRAGATYQPVAAGGAPDPPLEGK